jgi:hypothetical protein
MLEVPKVHEFLPKACRAEELPIVHRKHGASREVFGRPRNTPPRSRVIVFKIESNGPESDPQDRFGAGGGNGLEPGDGLWIVPCESVHTFFMKFPIDLIYLDRKHKVRKVRHAVPAWRLSACLLAHSVLELPAGTARETGTVKGDELEIEKLG